MPRDGNETAFAAIQAVNDEATGPVILAEIIGDLGEGIDAGPSDAEPALILWPRLARVIETINAEINAEIIEGIANWREARNPAVELGQGAGRQVESRAAIRNGPQGREGAVEEQERTHGALGAV